MIGLWADFFTFLQVAIGLFLIFIIMLQRGKGGGLVGALGGMGGASAFGPKADIQVLKLTIGLAIAWVVVACIGIFFNRSYTQFQGNTEAAAKAKKDSEKKDTKTEDKKVEPGKDAAPLKKEGKPPENPFLDPGEGANGPAAPAKADADKKAASAAPSTEKAASKAAPEKP